MLKRTLIFISLALLILICGASAENRVIISSGPSGAGVSIDGDYVGTTPITVLDIIGPHTIIWNLEGYKTYVNEYNILAKNETQIHANLRLKEQTPNWSETPIKIITENIAKKAWITKITSSPSGASVYIDGFKRGTTPLTLPNEPGTHSIWFDLKGYQVYSREYMIKENQNITIHAYMKLETPTRKKTPTKTLTPVTSLKDQIYNLTLTSSPSGAELYIDTRYYGTTPVTIPIMPGSHSIWWKLPMYQTYSSQYFIFEGTDRRIHVNMQPLNSSVNSTIMLPQIENGETEGDIIVDSVISNTSVLISEPFSIDFVLKNAGNAVNGEFLVQLLLSNDTKSSTDDIILYNKSVYGLKEGAFDLHTVNLTIPENIQSGSYYLIVVADPKMIIDEKSRLNNEVNELIFIKKFQNVTPPSDIRQIPNQTGYPGDPDGDGYYEDLNGNGIMDYLDVALFYEYFLWITQNEPIKYFDINGNKIIDYDDIALLFKSI